MKKLKKIAVILNPTSGKDFPVLAVLNRALAEHKIEWQVFVTKQKQDAALMTKTALSGHPEAVVVYGGDGTVVDVAAELYQTETPLVILPGGTANIMAKELGISTDLSQAIELFGRVPKVKKIDVGMLDGKPLFIRVEIGVVADMVKRTSRQEKDRLGIIGYSLNALESVRLSQPTTYHLVIDGKQIKTEGIGMMVANCGNMGINGISLHEQTSCFDGLLDVFLLKSGDISTLLQIGSAALVGTPKPVAIAHWQGRKIEVQVEQAQAVTFDDHPLNAQDFSFTMSSHKLRILV